AAETLAEGADPSADASQADLPPVGPPSGTAAQLAEWVVATGDNGGRPFVSIDKRAADVFVFAPHGSLEGAAPVLVGEAPGAGPPAACAARVLSAIGRDARTPPEAGFGGSLGAARVLPTVLGAASARGFSLPPVIPANPEEHRLERLRSPAAEDRRITYGCI